MPHELQDLWISEAILKALASALHHYPGVEEYLPHSMEQLRWKTGDRARRPTIALAPQSLASLLAAVNYAVSQNDDLLSRFGSFFFVLDARGIKLLSKQYGPGETTFQALQRFVPGLDWNYMLDRTNGELYLDLGVSFHPINTTQPMVGLWRLEGLRSSYALMGKSSTNNKEYLYNTMRDYGGVKAETSSHIMHHTHIVKRISYNLNFECVRQPGQQTYITSLDNAIQCNQKYLDGCTRWMKALEAGAKHSYGVRDELRASAFVVLELLKVVMERVRTLPVFCFAVSTELCSGRKLPYKQSHYMDSSHNLLYLCFATVYRAARHSPETCCQSPTKLWYSHSYDSPFDAKHHGHTIQHPSICTIHIEHAASEAGDGKVWDVFYR
jgi:hypothetical protein